MYRPRIAVELSFSERLSIELQTKRIDNEILIEEIKKDKSEINKKDNYNRAINNMLKQRRYDRIKKLKGKPIIKINYENLYTQLIQELKEIKVEGFELGHIILKAEIRELDEKLNNQDVKLPFE